MKAVMERLEFNWWNFHIWVIDESKIIRELLPRMRGIWELREEALPYLTWSLLGFPLGLVLGLLTVMVK